MDEKSLREFFEAAKESMDSYEEWWNNVQKKAQERSKMPPMTYTEYIKLKLEYPDYDEDWENAKHLKYEDEKRIQQTLRKIDKEQ